MTSPAEPPTNSPRTGSGWTRPPLFRIRGQAAVSTAPRLTSAMDGGCRTKPCTKTWAALAVMAVEGPGSAEAEQSVPRPSDDLRGFRPHPQNDSSAGFRGLCDTLDELRACGEVANAGGQTTACVEQSGSLRSAPRARVPGRRSRSGGVGSLELKARRRGHHGRSAPVHGRDDLLDVD